MEVSNTAPFTRWYPQLGKRPLEAGDQRQKKKRKVPGEPACPFNDAMASLSGGLGLVSPVQQKESRGSAGHGVCAHCMTYDIPI